MVRSGKDFVAWSCDECDGCDDSTVGRPGIKNTVTIVTTVTETVSQKFRRGAGRPSQRSALPGSYPQIAGAEPLREHLNAAAGRCSRQPPRRAHDTLQPVRDESVIVGYTL